ncbi:MAG TPA: SpoIIE family protein phosphatase [Candidatus Dormibacteraeota bacterium]|nr:SpoIIE family protein phosphatase [Candidatus Dormibacteraeota bacterium]
MFWRRLSGFDIVALVIFALGAVATSAELRGNIANFVKFLAVLCLFYLLFRFIAWWRSRLLWSLRNRLIVAYLFIALVPILLIVTLVALAGRILYSQLGAYLLYEDIQTRINTIADMAEHIAAAHGPPTRGSSQVELESSLAGQSHAVHDRELPGLEITFSDDPTLLRKVARGGESFAGLVQEEDKLSLVSLRAIHGKEGIRVAQLRVPVTPELLSAIAPDVGAIQLNPMRKISGGNQETAIYQSAGERYAAGIPISARARVLQPQGFWIDPAVGVVSRLNSVYVGRDGKVEHDRPVLAVTNARPSRLSARIFNSLGELRDSYLLLFIIVGLVFLLIELAALITGISMTRTITRAIADLYQATQYVQSGDLTHRVRVDRRDQLGVLGESFNLMTGSISGLIEEQRQRQRLENEISIAREVQNQLFPKRLPSVPGVEVEAICKAARSVSGDYYDFIQLTPTHIAVAIADISGKGISAALLMASLQAALRSQLLMGGSEHLGTDELVSRLNKHLVRNTADDRFATFFICVYDSETRTMRYTNAGHLPSFLLSQSNVVRLDKGGMVLGVYEDCTYEENSLMVPRDAVLVGYSDGLVEPENVYGEEFGIRRLQEAAMRVQASAPKSVALSLMTAAEEWAGSAEQADDMTVIVARMR